MAKFYLKKGPATWNLMGKYKGIAHIFQISHTYKLIKNSLKEYQNNLINHPNMKLYLWLNDDERWISVRMIDLDDL